ncbi:MAG: hypothetical protein C3F06_11795 [Candidatus Methanoperedenaceae archaeon]|nr:MAG: hypothetical protein C3F06_11795 [Candidatus Methanoperedenaceae archaeon]
MGFHANMNTLIDFNRSGMRIKVNIESSLYSRIIKKYQIGIRAHSFLDLIFRKFISVKTIGISYNLKHLIFDLNFKLIFKINTIVFNRKSGRSDDKEGIKKRSDCLSLSKLSGIRNIIYRNDNATGIGKTEIFNEPCIFPGQADKFVNFQEYLKSKFYRFSEQSSGIIFHLNHPEKGILKNIHYRNILNKAAGIKQYDPFIPKFSGSGKKQIYNLRPTERFTFSRGLSGFFTPPTFPVKEIRNSRNSQNAGRIEKNNMIYTSPMFSGSGDKKVYNLKSKLYPLISEGRQELFSPSTLPLIGVQNIIYRNAQGGVKKSDIYYSAFSGSGKKQIYNLHPTERFTFSRGLSGFFTPPTFPVKEIRNSRNSQNAGRIEKNNMIYTSPMFSGSGDKKVYNLKSKLYPLISEARQELFSPSTLPLIGVQNIIYRNTQGGVKKSDMLYSSPMLSGSEKRSGYNLHTTFPIISEPRSEISSNIFIKGIRNIHYRNIHNNTGGNTEIVYNSPMFSGSGKKPVYNYRLSKLYPQISDLRPERCPSMLFITGVINRKNIVNEKRHRIFSSSIRESELLYKTPQKIAETDYEKIQPEKKITFEKNNIPFDGTSNKEKRQEIEMLAEEVYDLIEKKIEIEKDRRGLF